MASQLQPVSIGLASAASDPGTFLWGAMSSSTGSILLDAAVGATAGSYLSPTPKDKAGWMAAGALATGLAGVLGLGALIGFRLLKK
jgi:hypothetical protein